jgi:glycosyltransferase involved in cell wall biosynthesis
MASETRRALGRAAGLLADTHRDLLLARQGGLKEGVPRDCVPGSGGLDLDAVQAARGSELPLPGGWLQPGDLLVINPRGLRPGSLRTDVFFRALPEFLEICPAARVVCPAMQGEPQAENLLAKLEQRSPQAAGRVMLLPLLPQEDLWRLMHRAQILVSPSLHDGTPNSLLEGLACGCFPVTGDTESMHEWIDDGINGLLYPAADAAALAKALKRAAGDEALRREAAGVNRDLVRSRASRQAMLPVICSFYDRVLHREGQL